MMSVDPEEGAWWAPLAPGLSEETKFNSLCVKTGFRMLNLTLHHGVSGAHDQKVMKAEICRTVNRDSF